MARKLEIGEAHGPQGDFDDQLWPVNLMLVMLAVVEAGVIIATSNFDDPRILYNGWFHLGGLAILVSLLAAGVFLLQRRVQRRMQLAILASLLVHLLLCLGMTTVYLQMLALEEVDKAQGVEDAPPTTLPVYHMKEADRVLPNQAIERAVETLPTEVQPPDLKKKLTKPDPKPKDQPEPDKVEAPKPKPVELQRTEVSTPKPSQQLPKPKLARSETDPKTPREAVEVPQAAAPQPKSASPVEARVNPLQRQDNQPKVQRQQAAEKPDSSPLAQQVAQLERRQSQQPDQTSQTVRQLQRQVTQANIPAPAPAATPSPPTKAVTRTSPATQPNVAQPQRQMTASPVAQPPQQPIAESARSAAVQPRVEAAKPSQGRTSDSGEPTVTASTQPGTMARASIGSPTTAAVPADSFGAVPTTPGTSSDAAANPAVSAPVTTIARGTGGGTQPQFTAPPGSQPTIVSGEGTVSVGTTLGQARRTAGDVSAPPTASSGGSSPARATSRATRGPGDASTEIVKVTGPSSAPSSTAVHETPGVGNTQPSVSGPVRQASGLPANLSGHSPPETTGNDVGPASPDGGPVTFADAGPRRTSDDPDTTPALTASVGSSGLVKQNMAQDGALTEKVVEPTVPATNRGDLGAPNPGSSEVRLSDPTGTVLSRQQLGGVPVRIDSEEARRERQAGNGLPDIEVQIPKTLLDRHGNVTGADNDLIQDGQMKGQSILIALLSDDDEAKSSPLVEALTAKGFAVEQVGHPLPPLASFEKMLDKTQQLWLWSSPESNRLPKSHLKVIVERWR